MRLALALIAVFCLAIPLAAQTQPARQATAEILPNGAIRQAYYYALHPAAKGWRWRKLRGTIPPGITLEGNGVLAGAPSAPGEFRFTLEATDSSTKPVVQTHEYVLTVLSPLTVVWTQPPQVTSEGAIAGEVQVYNGTGRTVDLTVIVVAVNTVNKAFALGYQRVSLNPGGQRVLFSSKLPRDVYVVHADAVAEIAETYEIYRARLQTTALTVP